MNSLSKFLRVTLSALVVLLAPGGPACQAVAAAANPGNASHAPIASRLAIPRLGSQANAASSAQLGNTASLIGATAAGNFAPAFLAPSLFHALNAMPAQSTKPAIDLETHSPDRLAAASLAAVDAAAAPGPADKSGSAAEERASVSSREAWDLQATAGALEDDDFSAADDSVAARPPARSLKTGHHLGRAATAAHQGAGRANHAAGTKLDALARRAGFDSSEVKMLKSVVKYVLIVWGLISGLHALHVSPAVAAGVLGASGTLATLYAKEYRQNILKGIQFLIANPFQVHDHLLIDGKHYVVVDMTLGEVSLREESDSRDLTKFTYPQLAEKIIVVRRPYKKIAIFAQALDEITHSGKRLRFDKKTLVPVAVGALLIAALPAIKTAAGWSAFSFAAPYALAAGVAYAAYHWVNGQINKRLQGRGRWSRKLLQALTFAAVGVTIALALKYGLPLMQTALTAKAYANAYPALLAASVLYSTHSVERALSDLIKRARWRAQTTAVVRRLAQVLCYAVGLPFAIQHLDWHTLKESLHLGWGVIFIVHDFFNDVAQSSSKLQHQESRQLVGLDVAGAIVGKTSLHVVFDPEDGRHVLVPHGAIKSSGVKHLDDDKDKALAAFREKYKAR